MPELKRVDHLRTGDIAVRPSGEAVFEVIDIDTHTDRPRCHATVRLPDGTLQARTWSRPDSVWILTTD